jgi:hypothetical protein
MLLLTIGYVVGSFLTDGGFVVTIKKNGDLDATIKISSTTNTNTNTLGLLRHFFDKKLGIKSTIDSSSGRVKRAPALRIQGVEKVLKVINFVCLHSTILRVDNQVVSLCSVKYRTMLIVKYLIENRKTLKQQKSVQIDLVKSMHKESLDQPDLILGGSHTLTRAELEARFNLEPNSSWFAAKNILQEIDLQYSQQNTFLIEAMKDNRLEIDNDLLVGLTDGDGGFHSSIITDDNNELKDIQTSITFTSDKPSLILHQIWLYGLGQSSKSIFANKNPILIHTVGETNAYQAKLASLANIWLALQFFQKNPPIGDVKKLNYELVLEIVLANKDKALTSQEKAYFEKKINKYRQKNVLDTI